MKQLEMRKLDKFFPAYSLPEGYSVVNYSAGQEGDYYFIYHRKYDDEKVMKAFFDKAIVSYPDCDPFKDTFFIKHGEEFVGTVTAVVHPKTNSGYIHMVCVREDYRGKGLAAVLNGIALEKLTKNNLDYILLTTDDWRIPAIKSYLTAGFLPVMNEKGLYKIFMMRRWEKIYNTLGLTEMRYLTMKMKEKRIIIDKK